MSDEEEIAALGVDLEVLRKAGFAVVRRRTKSGWYSYQKQGAKSQNFPWGPTGVLLALGLVRDDPVDEWLDDKYPDASKREREIARKALKQFGPTASSYRG